MRREREFQRLNKIQKYRRGRKCNCETKKRKNIGKEEQQKRGRSKEREVMKREGGQYGGSIEKREDRTEEARKKEDF